MTGADASPRLEAALGRDDRQTSSCSRSEKKSPLIETEMAWECRVPGPRLSLGCPEDISGMRNGMD
jgi:hypothetical protein